MVKSMCGAANLLAAIFDKDKDSVRVRLGIQLDTFKCADCRREVKIGGDHYPESYPYCPYCFKKRNVWVDVVCDECGKTFKRRKRFLLHSIGKDGYQHCFCNSVCMGRYTPPANRVASFKEGEWHMKTEIGPKCEDKNFPKPLPNKIYAFAWHELEVCFGEQLNEEVLNTMKGVLSGVVLNAKEDGMLTERVTYIKHIIPKELWGQARAAALKDSISLAEWLTKAIKSELLRNKP